jgi:hypothetical protein
LICIDWMCGDARNLTVQKSHEPFDIFHFIQLCETFFARETNAESFKSILLPPTPPGTNNSLRGVRSASLKHRHLKCASFWTGEFTAAAANPHNVWWTGDRLLDRGRRACDSICASCLLLPHQNRVHQSTSFSAPPTSTQVADVVCLPSVMSR